MFCTYNPLVKLGIFFSVIKIKSGAQYKENTLITISGNSTIRPQYHVTFDYPICIINRNDKQDDVGLYK